MFIIVGLLVYIVGLAVVSTLGVNSGVFINKLLIKALLETSYIRLAVLVAFSISLSRVSLSIISLLVQLIIILEF
jgi:hypothetical protein